MKEYLKQFQEKKIAILGFGIEGQSTLKFLEKCNAKNITVLDKNSKLTIEKYESILGEDYLKYLDDFDIIIKSPSVPFYAPEIQKNLHKITSQAQIFFDLYKWKVIALTATKGKSTTTTLIAKTLENAGLNVKLVGNIGNPVLNEIDLLSNETFDFVVYELSSYMLEGLNKKNFISLLGNIYPDHLDWHGSFENYQNAKLSIEKGSEHMIVNSDLQKYLPDKKTIFFGKKGKYIFDNNTFFIDNNTIFSPIDWQLIGEHNMINACMVLAICDLLNIDAMYLENTLKNFSSLPHRMQNIGEYNDVICIDDAISTTPESTIEAIKTFGYKIDTIFLGGLDRGYNFEKLAEYLSIYRIKNIIFFPQTGVKIEKFLNTSDFDIFHTDSLEKGVSFALQKTKKWKIILLSTASPSYNLWKNFEEKGDKFQYFLKKLSKN